LKLQGFPGILSSYSFASIQIREQEQKKGWLVGHPFYPCSNRA
jgi:hypothetical protein